MHTVVLIFHVLAGGTGLVLGPVAMLAPKRRGRHTRVGLAYQAATAVLAVSAVGLAAMNPDVWWLGIIGIATWAAALGGWWAQRRRFRGWLPVHIQLMCGSYISFVTAFLVVNWWSPVTWIAPTIVGAPLIARAALRARPPAALSAR